MKSDTFLQYQTVRERNCSVSLFPGLEMPGIREAVSVLNIMIFESNICRKNILPKVGNDRIFFFDDLFS